MAHERKSTWLSLRITQETYTNLQIIAARGGKTPSAVARELLAAGLTRALQTVDTQPEPRERVQ